uniref:Aspartic proteinase oryzasin-1 n=1 Tax=Arundo donax TaxID=35708 RepID=A0A0A9URG9_ARUDO
MESRLQYTMVLVRFLAILARTV